MANEDNTNPSSGFVLSGPWYEKVKWFVLIVMPALTTLYLGLAQQWDFPDPEKVALSMGLIATFLGVVLGISTNTYRKSDSRFFGEIHVSGTDEGAQIDHQVFNEDPSGMTIADKKEVTFKVVHS